MIESLLLLIYQVKTVNTAYGRLQKSINYTDYIKGNF